MAIPESVKDIRIEGFDYYLPDARIAKYPLGERDQSKLLQWKNGSISDHVFTQLPDLLPEKCKLVFNNTKVIRARLHFIKETGARIEIFVLDPAHPADYALNFQQTEKCTWKCIVGNLKKWKHGTLTLPVNINGDEVKLKAENKGEAGNGRIIEFSWNKPAFTFSEVLEAAGNIPIPPYLHRDSEEIDLSRYQTVFSKIKGSVAAPTAGLHFTDKVLESLSAKEITCSELTLHVGAGTFQPVKSQTIDGHEMHTEHFLVSKRFIKELLQHQNQLIAVGTTSIRTLESLYVLGQKIIENPELDPYRLHIGQWEAYLNKKKLSKQEAIEAIIGYMDKLGMEQLSAATQIIIVPGYTFRLVDGMLTNFHQPQSTLLLLISAFLGHDWKKVYDHALNNNYRFLSYGDSNLYLKE